MQYLCTYLVLGTDMLAEYVYIIFPAPVATGARVVPRI
jgi:hypothetical protein